MIDTHCHLEMKPFDDDREDVIKRAKENLEAVITVGSDFEGNKGAVALAKKYDFIYASVGIHPHDAKDFNDNIFDQIKAWAKNPKVVAIGETGLDYYYDHSPRDIQKKVFIKQIRYAVESGIPAIIHSREAKEDTISILEESRISKGVLHCFSGDIETAQRAIAMGLYISFAGTITFKKALQIQQIAKIIPDEYLLIETDAPYLAPEPLRGKRNEPAFVKHTAEFIANIRGVSTEDIDRITTLNAKRLFGIGSVSGQGEIAYKIRDSLYLNITNRCTSKCTFCIRFHSNFVKGHNLRLNAEPSADELKSAIGNPALYKEVVFCGYGEPMIRLDIVKEVASWVKDKGGRVRINTNGHGNLIHKRNILPELQGIVDSMSISLDAQDAETYDKVCKPAFKNAFNEVIGFINEAKKYVQEVQATVVSADGVDVEKCRKLTDELAVALRVRKLDNVG